MSRNYLGGGEIMITDMESLRDKIYIIRGQRVIMDYDLAGIYGYETKYFNRQVKNNIERFDGDFMFRLTRVELDNLARCNICTSSDERCSRCKNCTLNTGRGSNIKYLPYAFTEQGIYMLMTVLKGDLAVKQSKALIRIFKAMKDYIVENQYALEYRKHLELAVEVAKHSSDIADVKTNVVKINNEIKKLNGRMEIFANKLSSAVMRKEISPVILDFTNAPEMNEFVFMDGELAKANETYIDIYSKARQSLYIIDDYINIKTLRQLQKVRPSIEIVIFSDNAGNYLHASDLAEFRREFPGIKIKLVGAGGKFHDRFIVLDYGTKNEVVYHCGASAKDAGNSMTVISKYKEGIVVNAVNQLIESLSGTGELRLSL